MAAGKRPDKPTAVLYRPIRWLLGRFLLFHLAAGLHHVHYVVAQLLALADDVHVVDTHLVAVQLVVDVHDVLVLQLVAVVVDLVFQVEGTVDCGYVRIASR